MSKFSKHGMCLRIKQSRMAVKSTLFLISFKPWLSLGFAQFILRQTREKPLRTTVCFSIKHARARHAPRDAIDNKFIFE